jgi:polyisoprenoid-binding protein YceI
MVRSLAPGVLVAAAVVAAGLIRADERLVRIAPADCAISFTLQATLHKVHGSFAVSSGEIGFDVEGGAASGRVVVDAASGDTGNAKRDRKMHDEVLVSSRWPEITFSPTSIEGSVLPAGESEVRIRGILRLHDEPHEVEVPMRLTIEGERLRAEGGLVVPYVAWGLEDPSSFVLRVGKTVDVRIACGGILTAAE